MKTFKQILATLLAFFFMTQAFAYSKKNLLTAVKGTSEIQVKKILTVSPDLASLRYDSDGNSILMLAIQYGCNEKIIDAILKAGCSPDLKNKYNQTALMVACNQGLKTKIVKRIINYNVFTKSAKINRILEKDKNGKTSFDYAKDSPSIYKLLSEYTTDPATVKQQPDSVLPIPESKKEPEPENNPEDVQPEENEPDTQEQPEDLTPPQEDSQAKSTAQEEAQTPTELSEQTAEDSKNSIDQNSDKEIQQPEDLTPPQEESKTETTPQSITEEPNTKSDEKSVTISDTQKESAETSDIQELKDSTGELPLENQVLNPAIIVPISAEQNEKTEETLPNEENTKEELSKEEVLENKNEVSQNSLVEENKQTEEAPNTQDEKTQTETQISTEITIPAIDYYNSKRPEYLFDEIETDSIVEEEPQNFKETKVKTIQNPDALDNLGRTRLMNAIIKNDKRYCYALLESGANPNSKDKDGWTPLMYACRYSKSQTIISLLLQYGAKIDAKTNYNVTVLQIAAKNCKSSDVLSAILQQAEKENLNIQNSFITALKSERSEEIIKEYLKFNVKINALYRGKTPLMYAAESYESTDVIKLLLDNGADPYIVSSEKKNAFTYAKENPKINRDAIYWSLNVSNSKKK